MQITNPNMPGKTDIIDLGDRGWHEPAFNFSADAIGQPYMEKWQDTVYMYKKISEDVVRMTVIRIGSFVAENVSGEPPGYNFTIDADTLYDKITIGYDSSMPVGIRVEKEIEHPYVLATLTKLPNLQIVETITTYQKFGALFSEAIDRPQSESHQPLAACPVSVS